MELSEGAQVVGGTFVNWKIAHSSEPPENSSSYDLVKDEKLLFYQQMEYPNAFLKDETEVVVTNQRVILTKKELLRPFFAARLNPVRQRQQVVDAGCVRGYDSVLVVPHVCYLVKYLLILFFSFFIFIEGAHWAGRHAHRLIVEFPYDVSSFLSSWGGPCKALGKCIASSPSPLPSASARPQSFLEEFGGSVHVHSHRSLRARAKPALSSVHFSLDASDDNISQVSAPASWDASGDNISQVSAPARVSWEASGDNISQGSATATDHTANQEGRNWVNDIFASPVLPGETDEMHRNGHPDPPREQPPILELPTDDSDVEDVKEGISSDGVASGCVDFPMWKDVNGDSCARYAEPGWALSCAPLGGSGMPSDEKYEAHRDTSALELSPKEACCVCGGGDETALRAALPKLATLLWALIEAEAVKLNDDSQSELGSNVPLSHRTVVTALEKVGPTNLQRLLASMPSDKLSHIGRTLSGISVGDLEEGTYELPPAVYSVLDQLGTAGKTPGALAASVRIGRASSPFAANAMISAAIVGPLIWRCLLRIVAIITMIWCALRIYGWCDERVRLGRIYVLLRVHQDFFGGALPAEDCKPPGPGRGLTPGLGIGFYLPSTKECPSRLKEFAAALRESTSKCAQGVPF